MRTILQVIFFHFTHVSYVSRFYEILIIFCRLRRDQLNKAMLWAVAFVLRLRNIVVAQSIQSWN